MPNKLARFILLPTRGFTANTKMTTATTHNFLTNLVTSEGKRLRAYCEAVGGVVAKSSAPGQSPDQRVAIGLVC